MKNVIPCWRRGLLVAALCLGAPALFAQSRTSITNPTFADADGDGTPDGWKPYPDYEGLSSIPGGGARINDQDTSKGLGLAQWLSAAEGTQYRATLEVQGTGGLFVYLIFTPRIPGKEADVGKIQLLEKRQWASAKAEKSMVTIEATAPAGSKHLRLWLYSPNANQADVTISSIKLEALGTIAQPPTPAPAEATSSAPAVVMPAGPVPEGNLLQNPTFADSNGDTIPEEWSFYPPGDGASRILAAAPGGGLIFKDGDKNNGLGVEQWVPAQEGIRYTASADLVGSGGFNLTLIFAKEKPARAGDLESVQLSEKARWINAGKVSTNIAVAPAGTKWLKVWLYCPKVGIADVVVRQTSLIATAPTTPRPAGLSDVIDFETGDFSQAHSTEGGTVSVITAADGPVREGKYAFKTSVKKTQHRAEVAGPRCPPYGIARYGWSLYVPTEFDADSFFSIITQWHDWGTGRQSPPDGGPPTSISVSKGQVSLKVHYQGDDGWTTQKQYLPVCKIDELRGQWTDWVMEANWQPPGKGGWLKLYINDKLVIDYKGTTFYEEKDKGPYFKFGNYKGGGSWKGEEGGAVLYFDSFRMALGENSTYQMVNPSTYSPRPVK
jgi:hypothetical protein